MGAGSSRAGRTRRERDDEGQASGGAAAQYPPVPFPSAGPNPHYPWPQGQQTMQYRVVSSNGQYFMGNAPYPQYASQSSMRAAPPPVADQTCARVNTTTITNAVMLEKASLKDADRLLVSFRFRATRPCEVSVFWDVEEVKTRLVSGPYVLPPSTRTAFDKGLSQEFTSTPSDGLLRSSVPASILFSPEAGRFPLVVRMETIKRSMPTAGSELPMPPGCTLPTWVQAQTTYASLTESSSGDIEARVLKQRIWVEGESYEPQEIYGIDQVMGSSADESAKECVICMSEPRDTTVMPCRHLCMCSTCARMLRHQTNRCPICRTTVESLLEIRLGSRLG